MKEYMNKPVEKNWTNEEIVREYEKCHDKKKIAKIFSMTTKTLNKIINEEEMKGNEN